MTGAGAGSPDGRFCLSHALQGSCCFWSAPGTCHVLARSDGEEVEQPENIDSTTASGRMMMQMLGAFAEFERAMVRERTQAGLRSARAQGRHGGRQPKLSSQQQAEVLAMLNAGRSAGRRRRAPLPRSPRTHQTCRQQCQAMRPTPRPRYVPQVGGFPAYEVTGPQ